MKPAGQRWRARALGPENRNRVDGGEEVRKQLSGKGAGRAQGCHDWFRAGLGNKAQQRNFPGDSMIGSLPASAGDNGSIPGLGRSNMWWSS